MKNIFTVVTVTGLIWNVILFCLCQKNISYVVALVTLIPDSHVKKKVRKEVFTLFTLIRYGISYVAFDCNDHVLGVWIGHFDI